MSFPKWFRKIHLFNLEKSRYITKITNQGIQPRSQVKVQTKDTQQQTFLGCLWEYKIFPDILFLSCCKHLKTLSIKCFELLNKKSTHIFWTSKQEVHPLSNYVWTWSSLIKVHRQSSIRLGPTSAYIPIYTSHGPKVFVLKKSSP